METKFLSKKSKFPIIIATFVLLLFIVAYACREESDTSWEEENYSEIEYAKLWYEANKPTEAVYRSSSGKVKVPMMPVWKNAFSMRNEKYEVVETDLMMQGIISYMNEDCWKMYEQTKDSKYKQSYARLVLRTDRKTNETVGFLMTQVPDMDWLEKSKFKPFKIANYLNRGKNFGSWASFIGIHVCLWHRSERHTRNIRDKC